VPVHTRSEVTEIRPKSSAAGHAFTFSFAESYSIAHEEFVVQNDGR
jgi:hypothetical protein